MTAFEPIVRAQATPERTCLRHRPRFIFLIIAPILYAAYALLTPPFQNFDENEHLYRAWQISSLQFVGERRGPQSGGELPPGLGKSTLDHIGSLKTYGLRWIVRRPWTQIFSHNTPIGLNEKPAYYDFFGAVVYPPIAYVPQALAIRAGQAADLSVEWTLRFGRLVNAALCIALVLWALRIIPFGRWQMTIVALSPPMVAGAASFGQDAIVNGGAFLLTGLLLRTVAEQHWTKTRAALVAGSAGIIVLAKLVYLPFVALAAFPRPQALSLWRWLLPPLAIGVVIVGLLCAWMRVTSGAVIDPFRPGAPSFSEHVIWIINHPAAFLALVGRTWLVWLPSLWERLYVFGDSTVAIVRWAAVLGTGSLFAAMICGDPKAPSLTKGRIAWVMFVVFSIILLITTAMFVSIGRYDDRIIEGIQGRYFLPVLPILAITFMRRGPVAPPAMLDCTLALALSANLVTLGTLAKSFYTF